MLRDKAVPVTALSLTDLEQSALDWSQFDFDPAYKPVMKAKKQLRPHQTPALEAVKEGWRLPTAASLLWRAAQENLHLAAYR